MGHGFCLTRARARHGSPRFSRGCTTSSKANTVTPQRLTSEPVVQNESRLRSVALGPSFPNFCLFSPVPGVTPASFVAEAKGVERPHSEALPVRAPLD